MPKPIPPAPFFNTHGYVGSGVVKSATQVELAIDRLPAFLRVLLVTDGTVTKSLEAYFWEPITVEPVAQRTTVAARALPALDLAAGAAVLERQVRLIGAHRGDVYVYAESVLRLEALSAALREDLLAGRIGIGEMLRERGLETYREILDVGSVAAPELSPLFGIAVETVVYRTYRIFLHHRPAILITEKFPLARYADATP